MEDKQNKDHESESAEFNAADTIMSILYERKISQGKLGKMIGARQSTISSWSSGRNQPTYGMILKVCTAFKMTLLEFVIRGTPVQETDIDKQIKMVASTLSPAKKEHLLVYAKFLSYEERIDP